MNKTLLLPKRQNIVARAELPKAPSINLEKRDDVLKPTKRFDQIFILFIFDGKLQSRAELNRSS